MSRRHLKSVFFIALWIGISPLATLAEEPPPKILGQCSVDDLRVEPFAEWFDSGFEDYTPDAATAEALAAVDWDGVHIEVFFGTWCGDSRREVPRLAKLLDTLAVPASARRLIAVDNAEELHKRSPQGEEVGRAIFRVPTLIVSRHGEELARLVEFPALSLERDLLAILQGESYTANYRSYPVVQRWLQQGLLKDANISADGLAEQVRHLVTSEWELYSVGRVLWSRGDVDEAAKLLQANCALFRESASCHARLAEAQIRAGQLEEARKSTLRALRRNEDPEAIDDLVDLVERTILPDPAE